MPSRIPADAMSATFSLPSARVLEVAQADEQKTGVKLPIRVQPVGSGTLCLVVGRCPDVMRLVGALAAAGEAALLKAGLLGAH